MEQIWNSVDELRFESLLHVPESSLTSKIADSIDRHNTEERELAVWLLCWQEKSPAPLRGSKKTLKKRWPFIDWPAGPRGPRTA
jgi:hypothetical protein